MPEETWKPIPGYNGKYEVSSLGKIKSNVNLKGGVMKPTVDASGYPTVELEGKNKRVHELVMAAFGGKREGTNVAMHGDGNKRNNSVQNLSWGTRAENEKGVKSKGGKDEMFDSIVLAMLDRR